MANKPKRKRDFKAEYARRIAKAAATGKTRQAARGHKHKEHIERAERTKSKYGASPAVLSRLRKLAKEKLASIYRRSAKNPRRVNERTIARGMRYLHAQDLIELIDRDEMEIVGKASIQDTYIHQLAEDFPVSIDDLEGAGHNPYWYH